MPTPRDPAGENRALPAHGLARVPGYCLARTRVTRHHPVPISPRVMPGAGSQAALRITRAEWGADGLAGAG